MNPSTDPMWSTVTHGDPTAASVDDDFTNFLNLADFQLDFSSFDPSRDDGQSLHDGHGHPMDMDTNTDNDGAYHTSIGDEVFAMEKNGAREHLQQEGIPTTMQGGGFVHEGERADMRTPLFHPQQPQYGYSQRGQPVIPPTPNSIELHGGAMRYRSQADSDAYHFQYHRSKDDQMIFTPLVSPAVTPLETQFAIPKYTTPGAYFSPLTSPALEAQHSYSQQTFNGSSGHSDVSTTSPIEAGFDGVPAAAGNTSLTSQPSTRRQNRRASNTLRNPARIVQQSPSMKPQRRKGASGNVVTSKELVEMMKDPPSNSSKKLRLMHSQMATLPLPRSQETSEADSISPEPLTESAMAPPPVPRTVPDENVLPPAPSQSETSTVPSIPDDNSHGATTGLHPATPASLMRLSKQAAETEIEEIISPLLVGQGAEMASGTDHKSEQGASRPQLHAAGRPPLRDQTQVSDDQVTPTLSAKRTPNSSAAHSTAVSLPASASQSPFLNGLASPCFAASSKRAEGKSGGRGGKSRNGTSSVQASPALKPKISPSIKPLLPEGAPASAESSALLLASKSNYQNLLEGNRLPGVTYPESLSTNLTSKRTSHKLAEQGRRNRINNALQDMAGLLPPDWGGSSSTPKADKGETAAQAQASSKASTVELAIDYIKSLQAELAETKGRLAEAEKNLE
ncbi:MAG: hypothetical protein M1833_000614 [Piccolia ochrophora]|nr:MAG: hypothetical protein M1833_000614 [Piccolia ochrophora]